MTSWLHGLKKMIRYRRDRFFLFLFDSSLSPRKLVSWSIYTFYCRLVFPSGQAVMKSRPLEVHGLYVLPALNSDWLCRNLTSVNSYLDSHLLDNGRGYVALPRGDHPEIVQFVYGCLDFWRRDIEAVMRSFFCCYWIQVYRTYPCLLPDEGSSFAWHYDEDPPALKKIFIYLDDTTRDNGAFRYFPRKLSRRLVRKGFISNTLDLRIKSQALIDADALGDALWEEGKAGHGFIFDNNVVHTGTYPSLGYRTVVSIEIYPYSRGLQESNVSNSLSRLIVDDYPQYPWRNRYLLSAAP